MSNTNTQTRKLVETALLIAIAVILSFVPLFHLPFGGTVTLCSMLPLIIVSYRYGVKWGLFSAFVYSLLQLIQGISFGDLKGLSVATVIGAVIFDYLLAYTVIGIGGMFRNKFKRPQFAYLFGTLIALLARFLCHFISGYIFFGQWAEWFFSQEGYTFGQTVLDHFSGQPLYLLYSAVYNGLYMVPEIIITTIVAVIVSFIPIVAEKHGSTKA